MPDWVKGREKLVAAGDREGTANVCADKRKGGIAGRPGRGAGQHLVGHPFIKKAPPTSFTRRLET